MPSDQSVCTCRSPRMSASSTSEAARAERLLAQLGRATRDPERAVDALLVGSVRQGLERVHVRGGAGRPYELGPEALGPRDHELHGNALDGDADRPTRSTLDDRDDLRRPLEALEQRLRALPHATTANSPVAPATGADRPRPRRPAPPRRLAERPSARSRSSPRRGRRGRAPARAGDSLAAVFGPIPGTSVSRPSAPPAGSPRRSTRPGPGRSPTARLGLTPR